MRRSLRKTLLALLALPALATLPSNARAEDVVRIAYIDPLSGPLAATGQLGEQHFVFAIDRANAAGALGPGRKFELVPMDNEVSPAKSLSMLRKAEDAGIHYITQGNGSSVAFALVDGIMKNNRRNPSDRIMFLNYAAVDPALTNAHCSWWHFRFDADVDMKMAALAKYLISQPDVHKVYLFNPDYSFGVSVQQAATKMLTGARPDLSIVGADRMPLGKVKDFTPYIAKFQAAGADAVVTGNWGQDIELLVKAAAQSGYKGRFFTFYIGDEATVDAAGPGAKGDAQITVWADNVPGVDDVADAFRKRFHHDFYYWQVINEIDMLAAAIKQANSTDPAKVGKVLASMSRPTPLGASMMRPDNHQLLQPIYVSELEPNLPHTILGSTLGFKTLNRISAAETRQPTTCHFTDAP